MNGANPRTITKEKFSKLVTSILVLPKMLELRPIVVDNTFTALGGNMRLRAFYDKTLREAGFKVIACSDHHFQPQGYTALWLLSESHFAVHTFPECGRSYIELSSGNLDCFNHFLNLTRDL